MVEIRWRIYLARECARTLRGSCNDATFATAHRGYATCSRRGGSLPVLVQRPLVATTNGLSLSLPPWPLHSHNAHPRRPGDCHRTIIRDDDRVTSRYHTSTPRERRAAVSPLTTQHCKRRSRDRPPLKFDRHGGSALCSHLLRTSLESAAGAVPWLWHAPLFPFPLLYPSYRLVSSSPRNTY